MSRELFVGNLAFTVTDEDLRKAFSAAGTVESAKVITDRMSGRSRGFGFVTMGTPAEAAAAIETMNNAELESRAIRVHFSNSSDGTRSPSSSPRPRTGGGNGGGGGFQRKPYGGGNGGGSRY